MVINKTGAGVILAGLMVALAGCYESPGAKVYEPGEYKGPKDPLLKLQESEQQQERLAERFEQGQTDR